MTVQRRQESSAELFLHPTSLSVLGAGSKLGQRVLSNIKQACFTGILREDDLSIAPDLALLAGPPERAEADLLAIAKAGGRAAIALSPVPRLGELARAASVRVLGPNSFGVAAPRYGLNASLSHMPIPAGHIALLTQSASLARAIVDWAGPNGVGFSHIVGIGGNEDVGFGLLLDALSRDPDTKLILLDIRRVRDRRVFISAARAAARLRPIVALWPGGRLRDNSGQAAAIAQAALRRAGMFMVRDLESFLAAAETLSRVRPLRSEAMAVVTNAVGPGRLAADAALEAGIKLATLPPEAQMALTESLPAELMQGLVYAGAASPTDVASIAAMISAVPEVGGVLVLLSPTGPGDSAGIESVLAAAQTARLPVLTSVMGESTGAAHRRRLAQAGVPVFATPEQAVRAFGHLLNDRQARLAARELPGSRILNFQPDHASVDRILARARTQPDQPLSSAESLALLAAYGISQGTGPARASLRVTDDPSFGPAIALSAHPNGQPAYELPPLNLNLAEALAQRAGLAAADVPAVADIAVRISQMLTELPQIGSIALQMGPDWASTARITLRPPGDLAILAISPYPDHLVESWQSRGQAFTIRPIRPEDAEAHGALIARLPPQDLRYRFFSSLRQVSPEQMARLTQIDYDREMAFIAVRESDHATVGVARLVRDADAHGEFAILVQPDTKGLGLARHLMDRLTDWARFVGIETISGLVLADNTPMLGFMRHLGFTLRRLPDEPDIIEATLDTSQGQTSAS